MSGRAVWIHLILKELSETQSMFDTQQMETQLIFHTQQTEAQLIFDAQRSVGEAINIAVSGSTGLEIHNRGFMS